MFKTLKGACCLFLERCEAARWRRAHRRVTIWRLMQEPDELERIGIFANACKPYLDMSEQEKFDEAVQELHEAAQKLIDLCVEEQANACDSTESIEKLDHYRGQVSIAKGLKAHIEHNTRVMRAARETTYKIGFVEHETVTDEEELTQIRRDPYGAIMWRYDPMTNILTLRHLPEEN